MAKRINNQLYDSRVKTALGLKFAVLLFFLGGPIALSAQGFYGKKSSDAFPESMRYQQSGYYFSPGFNLTFPFINNNEQTSALTDTTNATRLISPNLKWGYNAEIGWYKITENLIIKYIDAGIRYAKTGGALTTNNILTQSITGDTLIQIPTIGSFNDHALGGHFNVNFTTRLTNVHFLQNTFGVSANYTFIANRLPAINPFLQQPAPEFPNRIQTQLNYKLGAGVRLYKKLMVIAALETPVLGIYQFYNGRSELQYYTNWFRTVQFSLRFMLIRKIDLEKCPPVKHPAGNPIGTMDNSGVN